MGDLISGLANQAEGPAVGDLMVWTDVSDASQAASGTTKKNEARFGVGAQVNAQTGTTYTYLTTDFRKLVTHSNGAAIAGTLPQASASFPAGWYMFVQNRGAGALTITPTTSTIDGAATLVLNQNEGAIVVSDGANYFTLRGKATGAAGVGDVVGPASAVDERIAVFDGATGKLIKDGGSTIADVLAAGGGMTNPMTTAGDIIRGGASGTPTRVAVGSEGQFLKVTGGVPAWGGAGAGNLNDALGHHVQYQSNSNQSGIQTFGAAAAGVNGTASNGADATGPFATYTSSTALNNDAGIFPSGGGFNTHQTRWDFTYYAKMKVGSVITELRMWAGVFSSNAHFASDTPANHYAAFRFTTGAGDTNWKCVTDNASGSPTVTDSGIAVVASAVHELKIVSSGDGSSIAFYIDGALVATHTTTLPTNSTPVGPCVTARNLGSTNAKAISLQRMVVSTP